MAADKIGKMSKFSDFNENWYLGLFWSEELIGNDENCTPMAAILKMAADKIGKISMFSDFNEHWYPFFVLKGVLIGVRFTKETSAINYFLISAHLSNSITSDNRDPNNALNSDMGVAWGLLCLHPNTIKPRWFCNCSDSVVFSCILFYYLYMLCIVSLRIKI